MRMILAATLLLATGAVPAAASPGTPRPIYDNSQFVEVQQRGTNFPYMMPRPPMGAPGLARPYTQAPPVPPAPRQPFVLGQGGGLRGDFGAASRPGMLTPYFNRRATGSR